MRWPALLLLVGCSATSPIFQPPTTYPAGEQVDILEASADWNERLLPECQLRWGDQGEWVVLNQRPKTGTPGWTSRRLRRIQMVMGPDVGVGLRALARHEFGHAIGIDGHTPTGVMHDPPEEFSADDINACREVGCCP
jgi:hypothetical protein